MARSGLDVESEGSSVRRFGLLSVVGLLVPGLLLVPAVTAPASASPAPVAPAVQEVRVSGVSSEVPGPGGAIRAQSAARTVVLTEEIGTRAFSVVGVTWAADDAIGEVEVYVRTRSAAGWSSWSALGGVSEDEPDAGTSEAGARLRGGTSPLWVGQVDGVQARVDVLSGADPRDVRLSLVDPGESPADGAVAGARLVTSAASSTPVIRSRADWGADESLRRSAPSYASGIHAVTLHHTASSTDYTAEDVPKLLRGFYAYHVKSNGWSDLGYNFVVDKFGRIWEGRAGGTDRPVIGSHTGGFNTGTVGVSVIGTYDSTAMSAAAQEAVAQIAGWRLGLAGKDPEGTVRVYSAGSTRYPKGTLVTLPRVFGHQDGSTTACPGEEGMAALPGIRTRAAAVAAGAAPAPAPDPVPAPVAASPDGLQLEAPTVAAAGSTVGITVRGGAGGAAVEVWFARRGDPTFSRRREALFGPDGTFRTSYIANDQYTVFAVSGAHTSRRVTTTLNVLPPLTAPAPAKVVVDAPSVIDAGEGVPVMVTGTPGAVVEMWFRRRGSEVWSRRRDGQFDAHGRWSTSYLAVDDHEYWASSQGRSSSDVKTLAMPVLVGPRNAPLGSSVELTGRARPGDEVVVEWRRRGATAFVATTVLADDSGAFRTSYRADDEYEYRPRADTRVGAMRRTSVAPTVAAASTARRGASIALSGTARPGSQVEVLLRRDGQRSLGVGGSRPRDLPIFRVGRVVAVAEDGSWATSLTAWSSLSWYVRSDGNASRLQRTVVS